MIVNKWCPRCEQDRPVEEFSPDASKSDGLQSRCRACDNAKSKAYYARNRERKRAYYQANRERKRAYYQANRTAKLAYQARYRASLRSRAIEIYGGRCVSCGSADRLEFDHVDWDGAEHRQVEAPLSLLVRIARTGRPIEDRRLQLLCFECHRARTESGRVRDASGRFVRLESTPNR